MSDNLTRYKMLLLTGNDKSTSYGINEQAVNFLSSSVPMISELKNQKSKKTKKSQSNSSFERNASDVSSVSCSSEIEEEQNQIKTKQISDIPNESLFEIYKKSEKVDFEFEIQESKSEKSEEIDENKGVEQFLRVLYTSQNEKNKSEKVYKLSDLYYPENKKQYNLLTTHFENECMRNRFDIYARTLHEKRKKIEEFINNLSKKRIALVNQSIQMNEAKEEKQLQNIEKIKIIFEENTTVENFIKLPMPQKHSFNKISDPDFFIDLQKKLREGISNEYNENKMNSYQKIVDLNKEKEMYQEGKSSLFSFRTEEIFPLNSSKINEEDELMLSFLPNLNQNSNLWGESRDLLPLNKFQTSKLFSISSQNLSSQNQISNFNYFNENLIDIKSYITQKKDEKKFISINLANESLFLNQIHGKFLLKPKPVKDDPIDEIGLEQASQSSDSSKKIKQKIKNHDKTGNLWQREWISKKIGKKSKLQHSILAEKFTLNSFLMSSNQQSVYHRYDINEEIWDPTRKKEFFKPWKVEILPKSVKETLKKSLKRKREESNLDEIIELVDSFEIFKNRKRLSCRSDEFLLFEYIEETPLVLSNVGMSSKLYKYVYPQRVEAALKKIKTEEKQLEPIENQANSELEAFKKLIVETLGSHGSILTSEKLPLIGQLTDPKRLGLLILENDLFSVPVYRQKAPNTDFMLVRYRNEEGGFSFYLRKIEFIYTVGQIEPKMEIFSPNSRMLNNFIKRCLKFEIKRQFRERGYVDLRELNQIFKSINDHNIRSSIRSLGGEQNLSDNKIFHYNKEIVESEQENALDEIDITPEEMCLYERMQACLTKLKKLGLNELRTADKINLARNKYIKSINQQKELIKQEKEEKKINNSDIYRKIIMAKLIAEELHLTSWNLSQSFLTAKQTQGRLYLTGFGDPTNGHGGYSYVKKPLKTSRYEKDDKIEKISEKLKDKQSGVTGTEADLRKLPMTYVISQLLNHGFKAEYLATRTRWQKIDHFRDVCNKLSKENPNKIDDKLKQFAREMRITTKMQKENYQREINKLFAALVEYLSKTQHIENDVEPGVRDEFIWEDSIENIVKKEEKNQCIIENRKKREISSKYMENKEDLERLKKLRKKYGREIDN